MIQLKSVLFLILINLLLSSIQAEKDQNETRIVGGRKSPRPYPYTISLQVKAPIYIGFLPTGRYQYRHICGGSIISDKCVLTAAHCVAHSKPERLSILAGTNKLKGGKGKRYFVRDIKVHPRYRPLVTSDIAVLKINSTFKFGPLIAPIKYSNRTIGGGENATLTGWGYTNGFRLGRPPNDLQRAYLPTLTNGKCREEGFRVTNTEICTYSFFFKGACNGDSGGPLTIGDGTEVVGIVSYGTFPCAIGKPEVYTRVSEFEQWITENCAD